MKESRQHILQVAFRLFLVKTYKEVTMNEIVQKTGLSKGAFYYYFDSKEQVFSEVLELYLLSRAKAILKQSTANSLCEFYHSQIAQMRKSIQALGLKRKSDLRSFQSFTILVDGLRLFPTFRRKVQEHSRVERRMWEKVVSAARKSREIKSSMTDRQIAGIFISIWSGVRFSMVMRLEIDDPIEAIEALWNAFYDQLKS